MIIRATLCKILPSATTRSPLSRYRISPGTTSFEGIWTFAPSLRATAMGEDKDFRLSRDFRAFSCCMVPRTAFRVMTAKITTVLSGLPVIMEITAAPMRIMTSRS